MAIPPSSSDPASLEPDGPRSATGHAELYDYPELEAVLSLAIATVADAYNIDQVLDPCGVEALENAAMAAMVEFYAPVAATAARLATAVDEARGVKAAAVARAAEEVAARADVVAAALQLKRERVDELPVLNNSELKAAAGKFSQTLDEATAVIAARRAVAASAMRKSVQATAAEVAATAVTVKHDTDNAAATIQPLARTTCYQLALAADAADALCRKDPA